MRLRSFLVALTGFTLIFGSTVAAHADTTVLRITQDLYEDNLPQVKDNYVVWQRLEGDTFQIFLYDVTAGGPPTKISDDPGCDHFNPQTDGQYVVWWSDKPTGAEVWLYEIDGGTPIRISPLDGTNHYLPVVAAGRVSWVGYTLGDTTTREIFFYDVLNPPAVQITDNGVDDSAPRINDQYLAWIQTDGDQNSKVYVRNLSSGEIQEAADPYVWGISPQKDGNLSVSLSHDGKDWEVIVKDRELRRTEYVTDNNLDERHPCISGNNIVWAAGEGKMSEIFLAEYLPIEVVLLSPADGKAFSEEEIPPTFTWRSVGYSEFKVQFSPDEAFQELTALTFPETTSVWLPDLSFAPNESEWESIEQLVRSHGTVYWRVKGKHADGTLATTAAWHFTVVYPDNGQSAAAVRDPGSDGGSSGCFVRTIEGSL